MRWPMWKQCIHIIINHKFMTNFINIPCDPKYNYPKNLWTYHQCSLCNSNHIWYSNMIIFLHIITNLSIITFPYFILLIVCSDIGFLLDLIPYRMFPSNQSLHFNINLPLWNHKLLKKSKNVDFINSVSFAQQTRDY